MLTKYGFMGWLLLTLVGCGSKEQAWPVQQYLFLGHPYDWRQPYRIDPRLEALQLDRFAGIWLGGDVCSRTTELPQTLGYLDSLFGLKRPDTHWTIGNHDILYGQPELIEAATGRPLFYVTRMHDVCVLVLNTNLLWHYEWGQPQEGCERKEAQLALIQSVCDTLREASHLLVLHHHALFNELKRGPAGDTLRPFNLNAIPVRAGCPPQEFNFTERVYPWLSQVQARGIQVVLVGGDLGMNAKTYAQQTPEGIWLLGSGINNSLDKAYIPDYVSNLNPDSVLVFTHIPQQRRLSWRFVRLGDLVHEHIGSAGVSALPDSVQLLIQQF